MAYLQNKLRVVGLTVEKFVNWDCTGHNCEFEYNDILDEKYVIHCVRVNGRTGKEDGHVDILLNTTYGECGSGYCTASWGNMKIVNRPERMPWTHRATCNTLYVDESIYDPDIDEFHCDVFTYYGCGGDEYYPSGYVNVDMSLFEELPRHNGKRKVYIFSGESGIGKSSLACHAASPDFRVYETDSNPELPETIIADIVVIGNKYKFDIDDITDRLFEEPEVVFVDFYH